MRVAETHSGKAKPGAAAGKYKAWMPITAMIATARVASILADLPAGTGGEADRGVVEKIKRRREGWTTTRDNIKNQMTMSERDIMMEPMIQLAEEASISNIKDHRGALFLSHQPSNVGDANKLPVEGS